MIGGLLGGLGIGFPLGIGFMLLADKQRMKQRAKERLERQQSALVFRAMLISPSEEHQENFGPYALERNTMLCGNLGISYSTLKEWDKEHGVWTHQFTEQQMYNHFKTRV